MSGAPVEVRDLGIAYRVPHDAGGTLKERLLRPGRGAGGDEHWGLRGVSFDVAQGEVLGVVGPNGAGKSTLMKALGRVLSPTEGRVVVRGRIAPIIELGAGFNVELTGRENVELYGALLGTPPRDMRRDAEEIARWAGLEDVLDVPVRTYSSGMAARLAFATATAAAVDPAVLLVDEALSIGDEAFRVRSWDRIRELIAGGAAVVLVTHELWVVEALCPRALWLDRGRPRLLGPAGDVVAAYRGTVAALAG